MLIVSQDQDRIYQFKGNLYTVPVVWGDCIMGINLFLGNHLLGTFDTPPAAMKEMEKIANCKKPIYFVSGHEKWAVWGTIKEAMRGGEGE